jgi:hypothetical protein
MQKTGSVRKILVRQGKVETIEAGSLAALDRSVVHASSARDNRRAVMMAFRCA